MKTVLITGGNKGLGYEAAKALKAQGYNVYIGARDIEKGQTAAQTLDVNFVKLDVTQTADIENAVEEIKQKEGKLDILINNAGISGGFKKPQDITVQDAQKVYDTNVFGIINMMHHFIPLLELSDQPVVVNVSSGLGSFEMTRNPKTEEYHVNSLAYCSSKSAVNMLTVQYAKALPHFKINSADPGSTNTDLVGDFSNNAKPASEGAIPIVKLATLDANGPTGAFYNGQGEIGY